MGAGAQLGLANLTTGLAALAARRALARRIVQAVRASRQVFARIAGAAATAALGVGAVAWASDRPAWQMEDPSPLGRTEVAAGKAGGFFWVVGGFGSGAAPSADVARYNPRAGKWRVMDPLPVTLNHAGVFGYRGRPYVFGGFETVPQAGLGPVSGRLFRLGRDGEWTELPSAPHGRAAFAIGRIGSRVYVAGGAVDSTAKTTRLDVYDLRRERWTTGPEMDVAREHLAGAVAGRPGRRFFYAIGGRDFYGSPNYATVERFNPRTERWRQVADTNVAHGGFGAVGVGRRVVALGGEAPGTSPTGTIPTAEVYGPRRDAWRVLPDLGTPRHGLGVTAYRGTVYAIEGGPITLVAISNVVESLRLRR